MRNLPLLFTLLLQFPLWGLGGFCHAQTPDTVITITKLPYPEARIFAPSVREGLAPSRDTTGYPNYEACIQTRHARLLAANLAALQESKKGRWLKYLPTVRAGLAPALSFSPNGEARSRLSPTLSLGLNSSLLYTAHRDKQQRAATREAIIKRAQLQEDQELAKLHRLQRRLQIETDKLNLQDGVADIDRQLFNLYQQQYDNHDITPEEYLLKRKAFLLQELRNQDQITRIEALKFEIEDLAGCPIEPLPDTLTPTRK